MMVDLRPITSDSVGQDLPRMPVKAATTLRPTPIR